MKNSPLEGVRVLDFTAFLAGPFCTLLLAGLGAEVIKVEKPGAGDSARRTPPYVGRDDTGGIRKDDSYVAASVLKRNRGKRSLALDLRTDAGRRIAERLVSQSDVVVENFSPGTLDRLGLGFEALRSIKKDIILCSISGFGQTGPLRNSSGFDLTIQCLSGIAYLNGSEDDPPLRSGLLVGDQTGAIYAAMSILAALRWRDNTGEGEHIDVSLLDALVANMWDEPFDYYLENGTPIRMGNRHQRYAPWNFYPTVDGFVAIAVGTARHWQGLVRCMGVELDERFDAADYRVSHMDEVDEIVTSWTQQHDSQYLVRELSAAGVPCSPVLNVREAIDTEHIESRGLFSNLAHSDGFATPWLAPNFPIKFTHAEVGYATPAPRLGQDGEQVLRDVGGYSEEEIRCFREDGII